jgi:LPXTG-site transpeptidase (sortase) family protein
VSSSTGVRRAGSWVAVALLGATAGLMFAMMLSASGDAPSVVVRAGEPAVLTAPVVQTLSEVQTASAVGSAVEPGVVAADPPVGSALAGPGPVDSSGAVTEQVSSGLLLSIPSLAVRAQIVDLGFTGDGVLDVPSDGANVGWYNVSPRPGEPGNALLGGHYDWDGSLAVFWRLGELRQGDRVELDDGSGTALVYEVQSTSSVDWDRPLSEILSSDGGSSLTLFTCGGVFDQERGEYEQRVVVWATLVERSSVTARR